MNKRIGYAILIIVALFLLIQLVPYGRDHSNPAVVQEPEWDSPQTRELAKTACFDCHSNETEWPWYTNVAPSSWLVAHDVDEGRAKLNFSEWQVEYRDAHEAAEVVHDGEMPPAQYTLIHGDAKLSDAEREALVSGLQATIGGDDEGGRPGEWSGDDD